jgi:hypothetical protein
MSRTRAWLRFFSFASVGAGKRWSAGEDGEGGLLKAGERKDSRQATRGRPMGARLFIGVG